MMTPQRENELTLAHLLGISDSDASQRLNHKVAITNGGGPSEILAQQVTDLIRRTLRLAGVGEHADVEIVIGKEAAGRGSLQRFVTLSDESVSISDIGPSTISPVHGLISTIASCYVAADAISQATGLRRVEKALIVDFRDLGATTEVLSSPIILSECVLVGAGAIGNAFLRALRYMNVSGELIIADPKNVGPGNGNRCLYFDDESVGRNKAQELSARAAPDFSKLHLSPFAGTLSELVKQLGRVRRAVVAVDSRRVRRGIQKELPLEVIDASTTGVDEIIVHSHREPNKDACLACIYRHIPDEFSRERDIAVGLGIDIEDVLKERIDGGAALKIIAKHPNLTVDGITGIAFDSLFKQLCAEQTLLLEGGEQVLAPFAFASALAGALLCLELARFERFNSQQDFTNYFFTDPWRAPNRRARLRKSKRADCEFCSMPQAREALKALWADVL